MFFFPLLCLNVISAATKTLKIHAWVIKGACGETMTIKRGHMLSSSLDIWLVGTTGMRFNRPHPVPLRTAQDGTNVYLLLSQNGTPKTGGRPRTVRLHVVQHFSRWNTSSSSGSVLNSNWLRQPGPWPILSSTTGCERRRWLLKGRGKDNAGDRGWLKADRTTQWRGNRQLTSVQPSEQRERAV